MTAWPDCIGHLHLRVIRIICPCDGGLPVCFQCVPHTREPNCTTISTVADGLAPPRR